MRNAARLSLEELSPASAAALAAAGCCVRTSELLGAGSYAAKLVQPGAPASWLPERWVALGLQSSCNSTAVLRVQVRILQLHSFHQQ